MKKHLLASLLLLASVAGYSTERVQLKISRPYAILTFLRAAANETHMSATLIAYVRSHIPSEDSARFYKVVRKFEQIPWEENMVFTGYPEGRTMPKSVAKRINNVAIRADNTDQFLQNIIGIMPNEQWLKLKEAMLAAEPMFDKVMQPHEAALERQLAALGKRGNKVDDIFLRIRRFYGSTWSDEMPFTVSLYAIPGHKGYSAASPYSNSLALGVLTEEDEPDMRMSIAVHEMCHVLYEEQPAALQWKIDSAFARSSSLFAPFAYSYLNEGLATACGNGWAYAQLTGGLDTSNWYADDYINRYGKALYPMVKRYIEAGKKIDNAFVKEAIALFKKTFPEAPYAYENLLNTVNLYTDATDHGQYEQVYGSVARHIRITSCSGSYPIVDEGMAPQVATAKGTQFFVVHTRHATNYKLLREQFPEIKDVDPNKEGICSFYDRKKRPVVILNVKDAGRIETAVLQLKKQRLMDQKVLFTPLQ